MTDDVSTNLQQGLGAMFLTSRRGEFVRVRTPFWYPDGGVVDLFAKEHQGTWTLTDLGEALGWLRMQSISSRRSPKQQKLIEDVCLTHGVELFKGQLMVRCDASSRIAECVVRLGQAMVRVADLWFTTRTRSVEAVTDEVADLLQERHVAFERGVKLAGRSGREWAVDFQTRTPVRSSLMFVLASGSRAAARRVTEHVVAGLHDLSHLAAGAQPLGFVSLFDDTADVWGEEDFRLVESLSTISRWSRPDELEELLGAAA